ncbi:protein kinase [Micromonospora sp. WMMA1998]|uniref:serine/threonine-protein kinase n=1 Tax=Micromonospora sp. WMMA1998 TaxID=3015167 RepID=UPI00248BAFA3|nr:serine/threonine protein kinase [Micromonospora sp. WMMA1998]WBC16682.1 protein kinase [Micromonospora sp. WMMA1998]
MRVLAGRYRLVRQVGRGGSAVVWQAVDQLLDRTVAVKLLAPGIAEDRGWRGAVRREARAAARLDHPNVAAVYDYGEARLSGLRRVPFLVLQYVDGETLADRLRRAGPPGWPAGGRLCAEVAAGLAAIHEAGLVHRDVKPGNVLIAPEGAKLVDLGVALAVGAATVDSRGEIRGTPSYMSPEQLRGEPAVPACDVYALGLLLTECLTGRPPARPDRADRDDRGATHGIEGVPEAVEDLRLRCLAPEPAERPSADRVAQVLATAAIPDVTRLRPAADARPDPRPTTPATLGAPRRPKVRRAVLVGGLPAVLAGAVFVAQLPGSGSTQDAYGAPEAAPATTTGCTVAYSAERRQGSFDGELTVEVTGGQPTGRPVLVFRLSPGQQLDAPLARWQSGRVVRLPVALEASSQVRVPLSGTYSEQARSGPDGFALDGVPCRRSSALVTIAGADEPAANPATSRVPPVRADVPAPRRTGSDAATAPTPPDAAGDESAVSASPSAGTPTGRPSSPSLPTPTDPGGEPTADPTASTGSPTSPSVSPPAPPTPDSPSTPTITASPTPAHVPTSLGATPSVDADVLA